MLSCVLIRLRLKTPLVMLVDSVFFMKYDLSTFLCVCGGASVSLVAGSVVGCLVGVVLRYAVVLYVLSCVECRSVSGVGGVLTLLLFKSMCCFFIVAANGFVGVGCCRSVLVLVGSEGGG